MKFTPVVLLMAALALGASTPDFSGTWKQDISKSNFGPGKAPRSYVNKIQQSGPELKVVTILVTDAGERTYENVYHLDGRDDVTKNGDDESHTIVHWANQSLIIDITSKDHDREYKTSETWTLSADGKILTKLRHLKEPRGEINQTFVLEKQ